MIGKLLLGEEKSSTLFLVLHFKLIRLHDFYFEPSLFIIRRFQNRDFHKHVIMQKCQYSQLHFSCVIRKELGK